MDLLHAEALFVHVSKVEHSLGAMQLVICDAVMGGRRGEIHFRVPAISNQRGGHVLRHILAPPGSHTAALAPASRSRRTCHFLLINRLFHSLQLTEIFCRHWS